MKVTKAKSHYRRSTKPGVNCHECASMNADGTCKKVQGIVTPKMVCDLFTKKR